jgi:hypothetical protein
MSKKTPAEIFWTKIDIQGPDDCWLWKPVTLRTPKGYGTLRFQGHTWRAHRLALFLSGTFLRRGEVVMHTCDIRLCCNPRHLVKTTQAENIRDCIRKGRFKSNKGVANPNASITQETANAIYCHYWHLNKAVPTICQEFKITRGKVYQIIHKRSWVVFEPRCIHEDQKVA